MSGGWVCILELDLDETETTELVADLHQRLGNRIRTTTKARWLYDAERTTQKPFRVAPTAVAEHYQRAGRGTRRK